MKFLYFLSALATFGLILGNASGPGLVQGVDRTGSPLSPGTCNACHNGGTFGPDPVLELLDGDTPVDMYIPGRTYNLRLTVNTAETPDAYGFQMVALDGDNNAGGEFGDPGTLFHQVMVNGLPYIEHDSPLDDNVMEIEWTAPEAGSGDITLYTAANTVNLNGAITGDIAAATSLTLTEDPNSAIRDNQIDFEVNLYPMPASDQLTIDIPNPTTLDRVEVMDIYGRYIERTKDLNLDVTSMSTGVYLMRIVLEDGSRTWQRFIVE